MEQLIIIISMFIEINIKKSPQRALHPNPIQLLALIRYKSITARNTRSRIKLGVFSV